MSEDRVTPEQLRELLDYDPITGSLAWAAPSRLWFASEAHWLAFKAASESRNPFAVVHSGGYLCGHLAGEQLLAHRAVWAYHHGSWPQGEIDHIDHDRQNNRIDNLRQADRVKNSRNCSRRLDNTSGTTGVSWDRARKKWVAQIALPGGVNKRLGRHERIEDAIRARKAAETAYGFHPNHGKNTGELEEQGA